MAWTDLTENQQVGGQVPATLVNQLVGNLNWLYTPPQGLYTYPLTDPNVTTTNTSMSAVGGSFTHTITTTGRPVNVRFMARTNGNTRFDFTVDGVSVTGDTDGLGNGGTTFSTHIERDLELVAGTYTIALSWRVTSSTGTIYAAGLAQFAVREQP